MIGLNKGFYGKHPHGRHDEEDRVIAMSAVIISLGERITSELGVSELRFTVCSGKTGMIFLVALNEELVLTFKLQNTGSLDAVFGHLRDARSLLQQLIDLCH